MADDYDDAVIDLRYAAEAFRNKMSKLVRRGCDCDVCSNERAAMHRLDTAIKVYDDARAERDM
ncbi:hypothetical protein [Paracoccus sp. 22332]|uniref:hypothetical protein n=1 Tax=Paracoccus sp. 22332 TaxID=3453913 RepID=UPI003F85D035